VLVNVVLGSGSSRLGTAEFLCVGKRSKCRPCVLEFVTRTLLSYFSCEGIENGLPMKRHKGF